METIDFIKRSSGSSEDVPSRAGGYDDAFSAPFVQRPMTGAERMVERLRSLEAAKLHLDRVLAATDQADIDANWHMSIINTCAAAESPKEDGLAPLPDEVSVLFLARQDIVHRLRRKVAHETPSVHASPDPAEVLKTESVRELASETLGPVSLQFTTSSPRAQELVDRLSRAIDALDAHIRKATESGSKAHE